MEGWLRLRLFQVRRLKSLAAVFTRRNPRLQAPQSQPAIESQAGASQFLSRLYENSGKRRN